MTSSKDWWANKIAQQTPAPAVAPLPLVPHAQPALRLQHTQPQQAEPAPIPQADAVEEFDGSKGYLEIAQEHDGEKISRMWKGGQAMKTEGELRCPNCGSMNIFTRSNVTMMNSGTGQRASAKPRCFECGWTDDFMPGDAGNWGVVG